jgi:fructoselysine-6-phosphate deglycase
LKNSINQVIDHLQETGRINSLFFVGSGGAGILMAPAEFILKSNSTLPVFNEISSEIMLINHQHFNENSLVIIPSLSGTTQESVEFAKYCKNKGITTIGLVGNGDTPLAQLTNYAFVNHAADDTSSESFYLQTLLIAVRIMHNRNEFKKYDQLVKELESLPKVLVNVKEKTEGKAAAFAENYKEEKYHIIVGSGNSWPQAYYYGMCILEEMQWIKTRPVHAADFFHGTLELVDQDTSVILLKGEDETRPLIDRVERFALDYTNKVTIFDTKDYVLDGISGELRGFISPIVLATLLERVSCYLEKERNHPLTTRRYYRKVAY